MKAKERKWATQNSKRDGSIVGGSVLSIGKQNKTAKVMSAPARARTHTHTHTLIMHARLRACTSQVSPQPFFLFFFLFFFLRLIRAYSLSQSLFFLDKATGHDGNCVTVIVFPLAKQQVIMVVQLCHNHCFSLANNVVVVVRVYFPWQSKMV